MSGPGFPSKYMSGYFVFSDFTREVNVCFVDISGNVDHVSLIENIEGAIKKGQSRETGNIGYTRRRQTKQTHTTICVRHHFMQANTNNVNKTRDLLQTTGGKDEPIKRPLHSR